MSDIARKGQTVTKTIVIRTLSVLWLLCGLALCYLLAALTEWGTFTPLFEGDLLRVFLATFLCFVLTTLLVRYVRRFALVNLWAIVAFLVITVGAVQIIVLTAVESDYYPLFYLVFYTGAIGVMLIWVRVIKKIQKLRLVAMPFGITAEVEAVNHPQLDIVRLHRPEIGDLPDRLNGILVDTREPLSDPWMRFIAACRLKGFRIYQAEELLEGATGRISLSHLSQGMIDDFSSNVIYVGLKRILDILIVIILFPFLAVSALFLALAIRIESLGPVFFIEDRVGQGGTTFRMLKFRSMRSESGEESSQFTSENDKRITRVGAFIRRYRFDEIPQLFNIFMGEMSLIGPRPEQPDFVKDFLEEIPFYDYRHTVKPGITGWAQVTLGYVADREKIWNKLEYDLYYIKHQSFWLDLLIVMKTIKTVLTGFGAR